MRRNLCRLQFSVLLFSIAVSVINPQRRENEPTSFDGGYNYAEMKRTEKEKNYSLIRRIEMENRMYEIIETVSVSRILAG